MRTIKMLAISILAIFAVATVSFASNEGATQTNTQNVVSSLTSDNGALAGSALLGLYNQYKADGKLDLSNSNNVNNILKLSANIVNLSKQLGNKSFLSGLISGSKNLVNSNNSGTVLNSLASISNLDLSSIAKSAASAAAKSALNQGSTNLLSKMLGNASESITVTPQSESDTNTAVSLLSNLFSGFSAK